MRRFSFRAVDANGDGRLTPGEFSSHYFTTAFSQFDSNKDSAIQREEWLRREGQNGAYLFDSLDTDRDQALTYAEFTDPPHRRETVRNLFRTMDVDGNGFIEKHELGRRQ